MAPYVELFIEGGVGDLVVDTSGRLVPICNIK